MSCQRVHSRSGSGALPLRDPELTGAAPWPERTAKRCHQHPSAILTTNANRSLAPWLQRNSIRADCAVNPDTFGINLLGFAEAGIAVRQRPDIGAVEIVLTAGAGLEDVVVLHPTQAIEVGAPADRRRFGDRRRRSVMSLGVTFAPPAVEGEVLPWPTAEASRPSRRRLTEASIARMRAPAEGRLQIPDSVVTWAVRAQGRPRAASDPGLSSTVARNDPARPEVTRSAAGRASASPRLGRSPARGVLGRGRRRPRPGQRIRSSIAPKQSRILVEHVVAEHIQRHVKARRPRLPGQRHASAARAQARAVARAWRIAAIATAADVLRPLHAEIDRRPRPHASTSCSRRSAAADASRRL